VLLSAAGCSTSAPPEVDLASARQAVAEASDAARAADARAAAGRARQRLTEAETLAASPEAGARSRAATVADLALAEARCATLLEKLARTVPLPESVSRPGASGDADPEKLRARLRKAAEDQKRLEERVALLQRDLEATETELVRTKAKLKGIETKAEASSAIAEARILILRRKDEKKKSPGLALAEEKLERAERQLREENYGAAVFFALQAQELLGNAPTPR
jgi:hypothetical protein